VHLHSRTRVKICGITRSEDALAAASLGADAIGLVFYDQSPRAVTLNQAEAIVEQLPAFVSVVGLFVNAGIASVHKVLSRIPLDLLQFHGDESANYCSMFERPYLKAVRMKPDINLDAEMAEFSSAHGILVDAWDAGHYGGTGQVFDWSHPGLQRGNRRIVLAGGLSSGNVAQAIRQVQPWAVDVSSGVESAPGIKSADLIREFINEVQSV